MNHAPVAVSLQSGRVAIGGHRAIELLTLGPLARGPVVRPFGENGSAVFEVLTWLDGRHVLALATEGVPATGRTLRRYVLIDADDGKVLKVWSDAILSGNDPLDVRVQKETRPFMISADGGELPAPAQLTYGPERSCDALATKLAPELFVRTSLGILLPLRH